jgi:anion-transporting  ArsA/GET3 family ATPase
MNLPRVLFVTGKGGSGKSTVAAALALALSRRKPATLADFGGQLAAATLLGAMPRENEPVRVSDSLEVIALSQRAELNSFIRRIVPVAAISERMLRSRTFGYVTAALPGLEAFLLLERVRMLAGEATLLDRYVVIDAPATGTALELLAVAGGLKGLAPAGTLNRLADEVRVFLTDPNRFAVLIVTTPEELALRETIDTARKLRDSLQIEVAGAILNRISKALFEESELDILGTLATHRDLARRRVAERTAATAARRQLERAGIDAFELPMLYCPMIRMTDISLLASKLAGGLAVK